MAQSATASRKTPLIIDAFWDTATITTTLSWGKNATMETLIVGKKWDTTTNSGVTYPPKPG